MKTYAYALNGGQYVLTVDGVPQTAPADTVALGFDKKDGTLFKHGKPETVSQWTVTAAGKLREAGLQDWADDLVMVEGRFPLEEINKCLDISGYCKVFFAKLQCGEIEGMSYDSQTHEEAQLVGPKPNA